jgi:hypothetical protein
VASPLRGRFGRRKLPEAPPAPPRDGSQCVPGDGEELAGLSGDDSRGSRDPVQRRDLAKAVARQQIPPVSAGCEHNRAPAQEHVVAVVNLTCGDDPGSGVDLVCERAVYELVEGATVHSA